MKCVIHIGTEKTGSTALQNYLHERRTRLAGSGVHFCKTAGPRNNRALPAAFVSEDREDDYIRRRGFASPVERAAWRDEVLENVRREIEGARWSCDTFILSSEHFQSRLWRPDEVARFADFISPLFDSTEVVCYLRRQDRMAISLYSTALRAGHVIHGFLPAKQRAKSRSGYYDFDSLLDRWAAAFGENSISAREYAEDSLVGGEIVSDFLALLGLEPDTGYQAAKHNESLSADALQVLLFANEFLQSGNPRQALEVRKRLVNFLLREGQGPRALPALSDVERFMGFFEQSNRRCARRWFDRDELFDSDYSAYPTEAYTGDPTRIVELLRTFSAKESQ